jgi:hypothetical protein
MDEDHTGWNHHVYLERIGSEPNDHERTEKIFHQLGQKYLPIKMRMIE